MKCVIPGLNIKIFARAIHSLARIGDELFVEPTTTGVYFRTVNSSRSAFGSFFFKSSFFSLFDFKVLDAQQEENFKCKVAMKACLSAFKSVNTIERSVEKCRLVIDPEEDRLVINMMCRHGIHKTYNLSFIECETLQAVFDKNSCKYNITSQSRVLFDAFSNFQTSQEEVTLTSTPQKILIRNYVDDDPDPAKAIHTELTLESDEFDSYSVDQACEVTFCLKEVRSLLSFSEPSNLPVCLNYSNPGSPIIFFVENPSSFEATFVLATLSSGVDSQQSTCRSNQANKKTFADSVVNERLSNSVKESSNVSPNTSLYRRISGSRAEDLNLNKRNESTGLPTSEININNLSLQAKNQRTENLDKFTHSPYLMKTNSSPVKVGKANSSFELPSLSNRGIHQKGEEKDPVEDEKMEEDDEVIPGTPPAKRRRFFFKRCFEPTFDANNLSGFKRVLAEDSDEEK